MTPWHLAFGIFWTLAIFAACAAIAAHNSKER